MEAFGHLYLWKQ